MVIAFSHSFGNLLDDVDSLDDVDISNNMDSGSHTIVGTLVLSSSVKMLLKYLFSASAFALGE